MSELPRTPSPSQAPILADEIRHLERARLRALVAGDMQTAQRLHAADFQLITPRGHALSKAQYLQSVADRAIHYLSWEPADIEVRIHHASLALIRYRATLQLAVDGQPRPPFQCWHTDSYEVREGAWQVVWSQATKIE
jgi:hypothetical protein